MRVEREWVKRNLGFDPICDPAAACDIRKTRGGRSHEAG